MYHPCPVGTNIGSTVRCAIIPSCPVGTNIGSAFTKCLGSDWLQEILSTNSASRVEYPTSLSYHPITFTILPITEVNSASKAQENELPTMSMETRGSSVYCMIPFSEDCEAF